MARVMLHAKKIPPLFWAKAVSTSCYIINRVFLRPGTKQTLYELQKGKKCNIKYFNIFGCTCYIYRDCESLGKFDARSDEGFFLGYSTNSYAYRVYNFRTNTVMESFNVVVDDAGSNPVPEYFSGEYNSNDPIVKQES